MKRLFFLAVLLAASSGVVAQTRILDNFESTDGWSFIRSDGVELKLATEPGFQGSAVRFDYNLTTGTGYGGIQKRFPIDLPDNFEFTFRLKGDSPPNNLEIKFIDASGDNVWWVINRHYDFPGDWKKIRIRKRHISFAWGPTADQSLKRIDRIEFTVSSTVGGKGTLWLDDLTFEPLPAETDTYPTPVAKASTTLDGFPATGLFDRSELSGWQSASGGDQDIRIHLMTRREFGGLHIEWLKGQAAPAFRVFLADDGQKWEPAYDVALNRDDASFIRLPEAEAAFIKIELKGLDAGKRYCIREIRVLPVRDGATPNDFLIYAAKNSPAGWYPRYFNQQASWWTVNGVNNDVKEALINEEGMVEVDKARFSIEPVIRTGDSLWTWHNAGATQTLGLPGNTAGFSFLPTSTWHCGGLELSTSLSSGGNANKTSVAEISYLLRNRSEKAMDFDFYLLIRPFQVNPYYQFLNLTGGAGRINRIWEENGLVNVDDKVIITSKPYDAFGAASFDEGNLAGFAAKGIIPAEKVASDPAGLAGGMMKYRIRLEAGQTTRLFIAVPFYGRESVDPKSCIDRVPADFDEADRFWRDKTGHIEFNLPPSGQKIVDTYRSNLAYILVNRDKAGIQPGSRSYERSWIRDGALTSSALLKSGIVQEVRDFIEWYTAYQFENGKVPCVVDGRGPDPVPENDSHGEMIYLLREYFNFTKDTAFLREKNVHVLKAVDFIEKLIAEQTTDHFRNGPDSIRACYGLVTESISHEGYSAKPMHSYWDDFFTMKGLKDAAEIQRILGDEKNFQRVAKVRDGFKKNLYNSISLAMKVHKIDYIPGCAELGDFDATSTTVALTPCNELGNLPNPQVYNTFNRYWDFFRNRRDGKKEWINYTPYENRLIGSFIMLDQPERAHDLIAFFLKDQHPQGWNQWAEVVWKDPRTPKYIGDMPHTWVGSDFINAIRAMFVYENEYDQTLVLGAALYQDWIDAPGGMSVAHLPTYYGELSYAVKKEGNAYRFSITGDLKLPANGIRIRNFNGAKLPTAVTVNGKPVTGFAAGVIPVATVPAEIVITY